MKILHIFKITGISGSENHLLTLLPALVKKGIRVGAVMMVEPGNPVNDFLKVLKAAGVDVFAVALGFDLSLPAFLKVREIIRKQKPDIIHTHLIHGDLYGILAARSLGIRNIISSKHNDDAFRTGLISRKINRFLNKRTARVIAISGAIRDFTIKHEGIDPGKVEMIHYGLADFDKSLRDPGLREKLGYTTDDIVFGIIARLTRQKGHRYLLAAFDEVRKNNHRCRLLIVGDGELRSDLESLTRKMNLEKNVRFLGNRKDTADLYNAMDIFVHPSLWEGFGLVFLEAMTFSLPIIATGVSAIPELVENGDNGILVFPEDAQSLKQAMIRMIENPGERKRMGENGREKLLTRFTVEKMVDRVFDVYEKM